MCPEMALGLTTVSARFPSDSCIEGDGDIVAHGEPATEGHGLQGWWSIGKLGDGLHRSEQLDDILDRFEASDLGGQCRVRAGKTSPVEPDGSDPGAVGTQHIRPPRVADHDCIAGRTACSGDRTKYVENEPLSKV